MKIILPFLVVTGVLTAVLILQVSTPSHAQDSERPAHNAAPDTDRRNRSGLHGLDKADSVAGEHGQEGRATARDKVMKEGDRMQRENRMERPSQADRFNRPMNPGRRGR